MPGERQPSSALRRLAPETAVRRAGCRHRGLGQLAAHRRRSDQVALQFTGVALEDCSPSPRSAGGRITAAFAVCDRRAARRRSPVLLPCPDRRAIPDREQPTPVLACARHGDTPVWMARRSMRGLGSIPSRRGRDRGGRHRSPWRRRRRGRGVRLRSPCRRRAIAACRLEREHLFFIVRSVRRCVRVASAFVGEEGQLFDVANASSRLGWSERPVRAIGRHATHHQRWLVHVVGYPQQPKQTPAAGRQRTPVRSPQGGPTAALGARLDRAVAA